MRETLESANRRRACLICGRSVKMLTSRLPPVQESRTEAFFMPNDELRRYVLPLNIGSLQVAMTMADTEYEIALPNTQRRVLIRPLTTTQAWRVSPVSGLVAGNTNAFPFASGESLSIEGPMAGQTLYAAGAVAGMTLQLLLI